MLRIDDRSIHIRKNLELVRHADVVAVRRYPVADHAFANLPVRERFDHLMFQRHPPDPLVGLNGHPSSSNFSFVVSLLHYFVASLLRRAKTQDAVSAETSRTNKFERCRQEIFKSV